MTARELGLSIGQLAPGPLDAITDRRVGENVRTGVTVIVPGGAGTAVEPAFAGFHRLNGNGEVTGTHWLRESGMLTTPIGLTNTHSVGAVRDAIISAGPPARPSSTPPRRPS